MFRIGEFAQIAQVSARQLRFYDEIGLFQPGHVDPQTGYRYYAIRQLPKLNTIIALKDLGLSLDQIRLHIDRAISPDDLRGLLVQKRTETQQAIRAEEQRLRHIESRIRQIERTGDQLAQDVVEKSLPAVAICGTRIQASDLGEAGALVADAARAGRDLIPASRRGNLIVKASNDPVSDQLDLTVGYILLRPFNRTLSGGGLNFTCEELPPVQMAATLVRQGTSPESHLAFGTVGGWIEAKGYAISGPSREIFLEPVFEPPGFEQALVEIQFPVAPA